mgnify:CR=1 FL=1
MDYKERLKQEFEELEERISRLAIFIHSKKLDEVTPIQRSLLIVQIEAMQTYSTCLHERINNL